MHFEENEYEEQKLISLLSQDSEYAFQLLFDRHRNRIYQTGIRYLKSPILAQEVVQDVFLKLWFERKKIRSDQPVAAWLYTVARNNIFNRLKKIANEWKALQNLGNATEHFVDGTATKLIEAQYNQILREALSGLSEQQRKVFELSRQERLTYIQIGEIMGISPLTVKTHMSRALDRIKACLAAHGVHLPAGILLVFINFF